MSKGISGGQAKRVNIGIALVTSPRVLFLGTPPCGPPTARRRSAMPLWRSRTLSPMHVLSRAILFKRPQLAIVAPAMLCFDLRAAPSHPRSTHLSHCTMLPLAADEPTSGLDSYTANEVRAALCHAGPAARGVRGFLSTAAAGPCPPPHPTTTPHCHTTRRS